MTVAAPAPRHASHDAAPSGVLVIRKPRGVTSHTVVAQVRKVLGTKRAGHIGTLDPIATGVLVVCLGYATRIAEYLAGADKEYIAGVVFGVGTATSDADGEVIAECDASCLSRDQLEEVLPRFRGSIMQTPPMVSAVHHQGRRLYDLARRGIEVDRAARPVRISQLEVLAFDPGHHPCAVLRVTCSTGTYVRALAADLGAALGTCAMMESLERTRVGRFGLEDAHTVEELEQHRLAGTLHATVQPIAQVLAEWPHVQVDPAALDRVVHGQAIMIPVSGMLPASAGSDNLVLLVDERGCAVAVGRPDGDELRPVKVFGAAP